MIICPTGQLFGKIGVMGYIPKREVSEYACVGMSKEEYKYFIDRAVQLVIDAFLKAGIRKRKDG